MRIHRQSRRVEGAGRGYLRYLLWVSQMLSPGLSPFPFFNQASWGSGTPWAMQVKMALLPGGLDKNCGHWTNSGGAGQAMAGGGRYEARPLTFLLPLPLSPFRFPWGDGAPQDPPWPALGAHPARAGRPVLCVGPGFPADWPHRRRRLSAGPTHRRS